MIKKIIPALILSIATVILCVAVGLGVIHLTNIIYYIDIEVLDIPSDSGYSRSVILENYHAVMDYLSPFNTGEFHLPSMPYSVPGADHFADCKVIFNGIYLLGAISFVILVAAMFFCRQGGVFKLAGLLTLMLPSCVGVAIAINFESAFILFHRLFFSNTNWMFDPVYDPVITILPEAFFMHCGIFIALCVVLGAVILFLRSKNGKIQKTV